MSLIQDKTAQAIKILKENEIDMWLTFVRETSGVRDPVLDFILSLADLPRPTAGALDILAVAK